MGKRCGKTVECAKTTHLRCDQCIGRNWFGRQKGEESFRVGWRRRRLNGPGRAGRGRVAEFTTVGKGTVASNRATRASTALHDREQRWPGLCDVWRHSQHIQQQNGPVYQGTARYKATNTGACRIGHSNVAEIDKRPN